METTELKIQQNTVLLILISIFLSSCSQKDNTLIELIINDYKTIDKSKNISIDIREDSLKNKYYFILEDGNDEGFDVPYYVFNFKDYKIKMLNYKTSFDIKLLGKINLDSINPKPTNYGGNIIDNFDGKKMSVYEITDSVLVKRMSFDIDGSLIEEKIISKKWK